MRHLMSPLDFSVEELDTLLTLAQDIEKNPAKLYKLAVRGMLPKTNLGRAMLKKLKIYAGSEHPHTAQIAKEGK